MDFIGTIPLSALSYFDPWTDAPDGTLLQGLPAGSQQPIVGMRCTFAIQNNPQPYLLCLSDGSIGILLHGSDFLDKAFDITHLCELCVLGAAPTSNNRHEVGRLYESAHHPKIYFVGAREQRGSMDLHVCVMGRDAKLGPGQVVFGMNTVDVRGIGRMLLREKDA